MKKMMILFSSLILVGLGMTACSKEGSKKQPNFRNRNQPLSKSQQAQPPAVGPQTGRRTNPEQPQALGRHLNRHNQFNENCLINADESLGDEKLCNSVVVTIEDVTVRVLTHLDNAIYSQGGAFNLETKENNDEHILAELDVEQEIPARKLKVLQIMENQVVADLPDELKESTQVIETDAGLNGLTEKIKTLKVLPDQHLVVVTNVEMLKSGDLNHVNRDRILKQLEQRDLRIGDVGKLAEVLAEEQAFLEAHIAQLSYMVSGVKDQNYSIQVSLNDSVLTEDQITHKFIASSKKVLVRIIDTSLFVSPNYKVSVEIIKD